MRFEPERVRANIRGAATEDLLDRVTVYREEMESTAVAMIETELAQRGVYADKIEEHATERERSVLRREDGTALRCSFCDRPAVEKGWGWHCLWSRVPVFPRWFVYCDEHRPAAPSNENDVT